MEIFMPVIGTRDASAMKYIIYLRETVLVCIGLVEISGMQSYALRIEPLQVAGFSDHAMNLASSFQ
jgi:hypothetical protein